jgi:uncharacterized membrane protein YedE/YeeE
MAPEYIRGLIGGILIGAASLLVAGAAGKIAGIAGIFSRMFQGLPGDRGWRGLFVVGLIAGAGITFAVYPPAAVYQPVSSLLLSAIAGLLVGFGTRLGGGCTSGHGVCGMGLGSKESTVAVAVFIAVGMAVVYLVNVFGGAP